MSTKFSDLVADVEKLKGFLQDKKIEEINTIFDETTGHTLLTQAVSGSSRLTGESVKYLLNLEGIDANAKNKHGTTPLGACELKYNLGDWAELLISKDADPSIPYRHENLRENKADLHLLAVLSKSEKSVDDLRAILIDCKRNDDIFKNQLTKALSNEARLKDHDDETALSNFVYYGFEDLVDRALELGADPNAENDEGKTPVFFAIWNSRDSILAKLVAKGGKLNFAPTRDVWGYTALHICVETGVSRMIELIGGKLLAGDEATKKALIEAKGAGCKELKGLTAVEWAESKGRSDLVELFKKFF